MLRLSFVLCFLFASLLTLQAQNQNYQVGLIGFYNLENLFDTLDTPDVRDTEFSPAGDKNYNTDLYQDKLGNLSSVIAKLGTDLSPDGVSILGVCEIENRSVLEDLVAHPNLVERGYQIVHHDSPDKRGIDVGLLYNPKYFTVTNSKNHEVLIYDDEDGERIFTRDVLLVEGQYGDDQVFIMVNHWPSRRGGEARSAPKRAAAALVCKNLADSIRTNVPNAKIVIMGDLNDDPISPSVAKVLRAQGKRNKVRKGDLYSPMWSFYRKGMGTTAWRDAWSLFDQIIVSDNWLDNEQDGFSFYQAHIYNPNYLVQKTGHFKGYPFRTFVGDTYLGGYSDHFPVYMAVIRPVK
ncbi:MAG: endonuclease/exonuclease/phosphatase family protein [Bacteroidota bacterium]